MRSAEGLCDHPGWNNYLSPASIQWPLCGLFLAAFEITRWRKVPHMLPQHVQNVPAYITIAMLIFYASAAFTLGSVWWMSGFISAIVSLGLAYSATLVVGGFLVTLVFRGDSWFPFTVACLVFCT